MRKQVASIDNCAVATAKVTPAAKGLPHYLALSLALVGTILRKVGVELFGPGIGARARPREGEAQRSAAKPLPVVCLAGSGGGHLRQLLDMEPFWRQYPHFFVTENTSLGRSIAAIHDTDYVPHFALGQARLGSPFKMLAESLRSMVMSWRIIARRKPDLVVTTGAGSLLFVVMWARLRGARVILIDSFARFEDPSTFARIMGPLADVRIAQSRQVARNWNTELHFDPLKIVPGGERPAKEQLLFATVGATLPFDRLVTLVLEARAAGHIPGQIIIQAGQTAKRFGNSDGVEIVEELPFPAVGDILKRADIVVCHGGTGSLITALQNHCRVVAVPRHFDLGEHYDDHQREITQNFKLRGLIQVVDEETDFVEALARARSTQPRSATMDPSELNRFLSDFALEMVAAAAR